MKHYKLQEILIYDIMQLIKCRDIIEANTFRKKIMSNTYEVIIVGGSFAGLSAAMQLSRARRRVLLVDAGQPRNRFAAHSHGFFGQDGKTPHDIAQIGWAQLEKYPRFEWRDGVVQTAVRLPENSIEQRFSATLADGTQFYSARLVLAMGVRDELPAIPGLQERWGATVLHCPYCHGYEVADQAIGVLANNPMSTHQGLLLPDWGPTTYFTQGTFEPDAAQAAMLAKRGVPIERSPIVAVIGTAPSIEAVQLADGRTVPLAAIFTAPKTHLVSTLAQQLGCELEAGPTGPYIRVNEMKQTSVEGVFAAGDAASPMPNAMIAAAAGTMAGSAAHGTLVMARLAV